MRIALTILLASTIWCGAVVPPVQTVTLAWDYPSNQIQGMVFRIYENGIITNVIATATNLSVTISNVLAAPHRWTVTASNMWGESDASIPLVVPAAPVPPQNLKPISTTLRGVPVPGMVESSVDLVNWNLRFRTATNGNALDLTEFVNATQPMQLMRAKTFTAQTPPLP